MQQEYLIEIEECFKNWIGNERSPIGVLLAFWFCFIEYQIKMAQNVHQFLTDQLQKLVKVVMKFFQGLYAPIFEEKKRDKINFQFLNYLSEGKTFKKVMKSYLKDFKLQKGAGGSLSGSQIKMTVDQLQHLINFNKIQRPCQKSIKLVQLFHLQESILKKIRLLVEIVHSVKAQVQCYCDDFGLRRVQVGFDQLFPLICYVCEQTYLNIFGSVSYLGAVLGKSAQKKEKMLGVVCLQAYYSMQLLQSASSFNCHSSKFSE